MSPATIISTPHFYNGPHRGPIVLFFPILCDFWSYFYANLFSCINIKKKLVLNWYKSIQSRLSTIPYYHCAKEKCSHYCINVHGVCLYFFTQVTLFLHLVLIKCTMQSLCMQHNAFTNKVNKYAIMRGLQKYYYFYQPTTHQLHFNHLPLNHLYFLSNFYF